MEMHQRDMRIRRILSELKESIIRQSLPVENIQIAPRGESSFAPFTNNSEWAATGEWWDFKFTLTVPETFTGRTALYVATGREAEWEAVNPQFELYINGRMEQALDTKHTRCILAEEAKPGASFEVLLRGYSKNRYEGMRNPYLFVRLVDVADQVEQLYFDIKVAWEAACLLPAGERQREVTLKLLCDAINLLDLRDKHSENFNASVVKARAYLAETLYAPLQSQPVEAIASCIGHTHIDVAWLWDIYQTRFKAVRSFSTVLKLMEQYEEYKFMSSQAVLYKFVEQDEPEVFERIKERVAEGRWQPEGGMWVEADCNLSSGESLVRQFLHGKEYFRKKFDKDNEILWLPDVFGYSAALPQIMKLSGIKYFMTSKLSWSEYDLYPYDTFYWKGIDGTSILTHFTPARDYGHGRHEDLEHFTTYNAMLEPNQIKGGWQRFQQKGLDNEFIVSYGFGDGGGGPTDWMLENGRRMAGPLTGLPAVRQQHPTDFFHKLENRVKDLPDTPVWSGELYLEYHRGTYTAIARNKRNNRKMELALRDAELWCTYASRVLGKAYPADAIHDIWEDTLTLQFHDILPGSSIKKVYDDSDIMYDAMFKKLGEIERETMAALAEKVPGDVVAFNSLSYIRDDLLRFTGPEGITALKDAAGNLYPAQKDENQYCAYVKGLPPMSVTGFTFVKEACASDEVKADTKGFDTPFFKGSFDSAMRITSLYDKKAERELCKAGETLNRIVCYENKPHNYDAWDINIYYDQRHWEVDNVMSATVVSKGPVLTRIRVSYAYMKSTITQDVVFYNQIPRIDFETFADWKEKQYLLKAHFPVDLFYNEATYDIQYGNVRRPTHKNTSWDAARFEVCAHKWVDVAEDGYGVSLLNDCKYGHSINSDSMALTLLKSSIDPNPEGDITTHQFTYSLLPHCGTWREGKTVEQGYQLNVPLRAVTKTAAAGDKALEALFAIDMPGVIIEAVKEQLDGKGTVVRLYESFGRRRSGLSVKAGLPVASAVECNMMEKKISDADLRDNAIHFDLKPYEIKSFLVDWK